MPLLPFIGPWLIQRLTTRIGGKWAGRAAQTTTLLFLAALLAIIVMLIRNDAYADGRRDLLAEQAEVQAVADEKQRRMESAAQAAHDAALAAGIGADAAQQKEITDANKNLPDARPTDRARRRACVELRQQDQSAGRAPRPC